MLVYLNSEMTEQRRNLDGVTTSMNVLQLNNLIVSMRKLVKKSKVRVIHKLTNQVKQYRGKKGNEDQRAANQRKADRLLRELELTKKLDIDETVKFSLGNEMKVQDLKQDDLLLKVKVRLSCEKLIQDKINIWRKQHEDWKSLAAFIKQHSGRRLKKKRKLLEANENKEISDEENDSKNDNEDNNVDNEETSTKENDAKDNISNTTELKQDINKVKTDKTKHQNTNLRSDSKHFDSDDNESEVENSDHNVENSDSNTSYNAPQQMIKDSYTSANKPVESSNSESNDSESESSESEEDSSAEDENTESDSTSQEENITRNKHTKKKTKLIEKYVTSKLKPAVDPDKAAGESSTSKTKISLSRGELVVKRLNLDDLKEDEVVVKDKDVSFLFKENPGVSMDKSSSDDDNQSHDGDQTSRDPFFLMGSSSDEEEYRVKKQQGDPENDSMSEDEISDFKMKKAKKMMMVESTFIGSLSAKPVRSRVKNKGKFNMDKGKSQQHQGKSSSHFKQQERKGHFQASNNKFQSQKGSVPNNKKNFNKTSNEKSTNDHQVLNKEPEKLHPSWEASKKRKQEQTAIKQFEGKKIKFDD